MNAFLKTESAASLEESDQLLMEPPGTGTMKILSGGHFLQTNGLIFGCTNYTSLIVDL